MKALLDLKISKLARLIFAVAALVFLVYMLVRPYKEATKLSVK